MHYRRSLILVVGLALAALLWWCLFGSDAEPPAGGAAAVPRAATTAPSAAATGGPAAGSGPGPAEPTASRTEAVSTQGCRGRTVSGAGVPLAGIRVAAVLTPPLSPFALAQQLQRGILAELVAATVSAADGTFVLSVPATAVGMPFEVWALGAVDADAQRRIDRLAGGMWLELGDVVLPRAFPVVGRVVDAATEDPIAGAHVTVRTVGGAVRAAAASDGDLQARTDAEGRFHFDNLGKGVYHFMVDAPDRARLERPQQHVFEDQPNELMFALAPGGRAEGVVVDAQGRSISGVFVRAEAIDGANAARPECRCDAAGRFALSGLDGGSWRIRAAAVGYQMATVEPVVAGARDLRVELSQQGSVRVRVVGSDGAALAAYVLTARPPLETASAALRALPDVRVTPELVHDGVFVLHGLDAGRWQLEVRAAGHGKAFSGHFDVRLDVVGEVVVALTSGGAVGGTVQDEQGVPLAAAVVQSQPAGFRDSEVGAVFRGLQVWRTTAAEAITDRSGRFTLEHLAAGDYQLRIAPAGAVPCYLDRVAVADGARTELPVVRVPRGTELSGAVTLADQPVASVFVMVVALEVPTLPEGYTVAVAADARGAFRVPQRLPTGRYAVMAGRRLPDNPFQEDADRTQSRIEVTLAPAEAAREIALRLQP